MGNKLKKAQHRLDVRRNEYIRQRDSKSSTDQDKWTKAFHFPGSMKAK